jgi:F0F1-type ATP synthase membrane subunit b/b'
MKDAELKKLFESTHEHIEVMAETLRGEMREQGEQLRTEMRDQGDLLRDELRAEMRTHVEEMRLHFDSYAERADKKFDRLAEAVMLLDEKVDRNVASLRAEMREGFAETHDLIRFSYNLAKRKR